MPTRSANRRLQQHAAPILHTFCEPIQLVIEAFFLGKVVQTGLPILAVRRPLRFENDGRCHPDTKVTGFLAFQTVNIDIIRVIRRRKCGACRSEQESLHSPGKA